MATTTPNFGWTVPTSSDLVKDGATAIETLGDSIDASMVDLKGGTTGQVLSKTSATDMDFTWVSAGNGMTVIASGSIANSATGFSITSIPATYNNLQLVIRNSYSNAADINSRMRVNNLSTSIYSQMQNYGISSTAAAATATGTNFLLDNNNSSRAASTSVYVVNFWDYAGDAFKCGTVTGFHQDRTTSTFEIMTESFGVQLTSAIDRIDLITGTANTFAGAGTYTLYGVK